jgi:hypothetical protein
MGYGSNEFNVQSPTVGLQESVEFVLEHPGAHHRVAVVQVAFKNNF